MGKSKNGAIKTMSALRRAFRTVDTYTSTSYKDDGLTPTQFAVLDVLQKKGVMRTGDLVEAMLATAGNITVVMRNMEKKGWITREIDSADRRAIRVSLTPEGLKMVKKARPHHEALVKEVFGRLTAQEQEELVALLNKLKGE